MSTVKFGGQNWIAGDLVNGRKEILSGWQAQWCIPELKIPMIWSGGGILKEDRGNVGINIPWNALCLRNILVLKVEILSGQWAYTLFFVPWVLKHVFYGHLICWPRQESHCKKRRYRIKLGALWHHEIDKEEEENRMGRAYEVGIKENLVWGSQGPRWESAWGIWKRSAQFIKDVDICEHRASISST